MDEHDTTDTERTNDRDRRDLSVSRRETMAGMLGLGGLGVLGSDRKTTPTGNLNAKPKKDGRPWNRDVDAQGHALLDLGQLVMEANSSEITDFEGDNLSIDASGVLNAVVDTDTRTAISDDGATVLQNVEDINFATGLTVTDDGDNTVTVDISNVSPWEDTDSDSLLEATGFDGIEVDSVVTPALGTATNTPLEAAVNGQRALRLEPTAVPFGANVVGGHPSNSVGAGVAGATVAGGGFDDGTTVRSNTVTENFGTVGGGQDNTVSGLEGTVAGGRGNEAGGNGSTVGGGNSNETIGSGSTIGGGFDNETSGFDATIGGGVRNTASGNRATIAGGLQNEASNPWATVGGGQNNTASGGLATIGGGVNNVASGSWATITGGSNNVASGDYSFAAGRMAKTETGGGTAHDGAIVFGDGSATAVRSERNNHFVVQAGGGATIYSNSNGSTGVALSPGSGSWSSLSTRTAKTNVEPVEPRDVLAAVDDLEISTWEYDSGADATHMGPMAEDFHAAFGLGEDERRIATVDANGVALAAIQGLSEKLEAKHDRVDELKREVERKDDRIDRLEDDVDALERENERLRTRYETLEERLERLEAELMVSDNA
ncbi:MAG: tail fiber domain-containing protein [Halobacteriales archaeon]